MKNLIFFFSFLVLFSLSNSNQVAAQFIPYPIPELKNCRDANECALFCQIPTNTPTCWSYDKYILQKNNRILGEEITASIAYPIQELGGCTSANECFVFCNQPENQATCYDFAKSRGLIKEKPKAPENIIELAKKELGCQSDLECMVFCQQSENYSACSDFGKKYDLIKNSQNRGRSGPSPEVLEKAKTEFGCDSESSCRHFCENIENRDKCFEFAKENNLLPPEEIKKHEEFRKNEKELLEDSRIELDCDSLETCRPVCEKPENRNKCEALAKKHGMGPPNNNGMDGPGGGGPPNDNGMRSPTDKGMVIDQKLMEQMQKEMGCDSPESCKSTCESSEENKNKCMGIAQKLGIEPPKQGNNFSGQANQNQQEFQMKKGPGGCASEKECQEYCSKHPEDCKGFPKDQTERTDNNQQMPRVNNPSGQNPPPNQNNSSKQGDFLGPGGCKTEGECKAYCEKHPNDCPGFPKDNKQEIKFTPQNSGPNNMKIDRSGQDKINSNNQNKNNFSPNTFQPQNGDNQPQSQPPPQNQPFQVK